MAHRVRARHRRPQLSQPALYEEFCGGLAEFEDFAASCCKITLDHQMVLLDRIKDPAVREWYLKAALEYG